MIWGADGPNKLYGQDVSNLGVGWGQNDGGSNADPRIGMSTFALGQKPGQYKALGFDGDVMIDRPYDPDQNADTIGGQVVNPAFLQWLQQKGYTPVSASDQSGQHGALQDAKGNIVAGSERQWGDGSDDAFGAAVLAAAAIMTGGVAAAGGGVGAGAGAAAEGAAAGGTATGATNAALIESQLGTAGYGASSAGAGGGFFGNLTASQALNYGKQGYGYYNTGKSAANGNYLGAAGGLLGAYTGYAGPSDATTAAQAGLQGAGAVQSASNGNYVGAAGGLLGAYAGATGDTSYAPAQTGIQVAGAVQNGNYLGAAGGLLSGASNFNFPDSNFENSYAPGANQETSGAQMDDYYTPGDFQGDYSQLSDPYYTPGDYQGNYPTSAGTTGGTDWGALLKDAGGFLKSNGSLVGAGVGALAGLKNNQGTQTQTRTIDPRIAPYIYGTNGSGGLLGNVNQLMQQQSQNGGLNPLQQAGINSQVQTLMDPAYTQGYGQMRSLGASLLNQGVAGNPFTGSQTALASPTLPQVSAGQFAPQAQFQAPQYQLPQFQQPQQPGGGNLGFGRASIQPVGQGPWSA